MNGQPRGARKAAWTRSRVGAVVLAGVVSLALFVAADVVRLALQPPAFTMMTEYSSAAGTAADRATLLHNTRVAIGPARMRIYWREEIRTRYIESLGANERIGSLGRSLDLSRAPDMWQPDVARTGLWLATWATLLCLFRVRARIGRGRIARGLCERCGYNRDGLGPGAPCPECGSMPPPVT